MKPASVSGRIAPIAVAAAAALSLLAAGCSTPDHLPGGKEAQEAATQAGEDYGNALKRGITGGETARARGDLEAAQRALEQYAADASAYPQAGSCAELASALGRAGRLLKISGNDPWGSSYECLTRERGYTLRSYGPDGKAMSPDDIVLEGGSPY